MNRSFDTILIGSGPCALAALTALAPEQDLAVVTGAVPEPHRARDIHPKIQVVALERNEIPGLAEQMNNGRAGAKPLFPTATLGGLANYWGQQFVRYACGDPYGADIFKNFETYVSDCAAIEAEFALSGGVEPPRPTHLLDGYTVFEPRLLTGTVTNREAGLFSMRQVIESLMSDAEVYALRAQSISRNGQSRWSVQLSDGTSIAGRKILLAAGVLGTARIVISSMNEVTSASFCDHSPYMAYASGLGSLMRASSVRHFNRLTVEKPVADRCTMYASIYDMSAAELNLLLASTIGRPISVLRGVGGPPFASMLQPVQIWTACSYSRLQIDAASGLISGSHFSMPPDRTLEETFSALREIGAKIWHCSRTAPGNGFHYHALKVKRNDAAEQPLAEALTQWSAGAVSCVDASVLPTIGLRPPTLTAMAAARRLVLRDPCMARSKDPNVAPMALL